MADFKSLLPASDGWLPSWLLLIALTSIGNSIQSYTTITLTARVYNANPNNKLPPSNIAQYLPPLPSSQKASGKPDPRCLPPSPSEIPSQVTPLSARTFGTWTFLTSLVRLYAAYHVHEQAWFDLGMWTFVVAAGHFLMEWRVFGTTRLGAPLAGPLVVSSVSLVWMGLQRGWYIGQ